MKYTTLIRLIFCIVLVLGVIIFCYGYFIYANGDENKYTALGGVMVFPLIFLFIGLMFDENEKSDIKLMIRCALGTVAAILILYVFFVYYYEPYMLVYAIFGIGFLIAYGGLYCLVTGISGK